MASGRRPDLGRRLERNRLASQPRRVVRKAGMEITGAASRIRFALNEGLQFVACRFADFPVFQLLRRGSGFDPDY